MTAASWSPRASSTPWDAASRRPSAETTRAWRAPAVLRTKSTSSQSSWRPSTVPAAVTTTAAGRRGLGTGLAGPAVLGPALVDHRPGRLAAGLVAGEGGPGLGGVGQGAVGPGRCPLPPVPAQLGGQVGLGHPPRQQQPSAPGAASSTSAGRPAPCSREPVGRGAVVGRAAVVGWGLGVRGLWTTRAARSGIGLPSQSGGPGIRGVRLRRARGRGREPLGRGLDPLAGPGPPWGGRSDSGGTRSGAWTRSDSGGRAAIGETGSPSRSLGDGSHQPDQSGSSPGAQPRSGPAGCWSA